MDFTVRQEVLGRTTVIRPFGEIDICTAPELKAHMRSVIEAGAERLLVDLSAVGFMDSSGLGVLKGAQKRIGERGGALAIVCPEGAVLKVFRISGLMEVFRIHDSLDEGLQEMER